MRSTSLVSFAFLLWAPAAHADAPPPSQALATDPEAPTPRVGLSADGIGVALADYALRVDWAPEPFHALTLLAGESRRHGGDTLLLAVGWSVWPMASGLDGFFVGASVGIAWAGPWNGDDPAARTVGRLEGELGWQFLWGELSITLAAGATGLWAPDQGGVWAEPHGRLALGIVFR